MYPLVQTRRKKNLKQIKQHEKLAFYMFAIIVFKNSHVHNANTKIKQLI